MLNGVTYFIMYATQWTAFMTTVCMLVIWHAANKEHEYELLTNPHEAEGSSDGETFPVNSSPEMNRISNP